MNENPTNPAWRRIRSFRRRAGTAIVAVACASASLLPGEYGVPLAAASAIEGPCDERSLVLRAPVSGQIVEHFDLAAGQYGAGRRGVRWHPTPGTVVRSPASGAVRFAGKVADTVWVTVEVASGELVSVGPLAAATATTGRPVTRGDPVGISGPMLHLGLRRCGDYVDPEPFFRPTRPHLVRRADGGRSSAASP